MVLGICLPFYINAQAGSCFFVEQQGIFSTRLVLVVKVRVQQLQPLPYINPVPVQWTAATVLFGAARFPF